MADARSDSLANDGAPNILDVATGAGYGSHEAFTCAFKEQFDLNPEELRSRGQQQALQLKEPLRMNAVQAVPLDPPVVQTLPATDYIGLAQTYAMTELGRIPQQWVAFRQRLAGLDRSAVGAAYGICRNASPNGEGLEYVCAVPASAGMPATSGLSRLNLPEMRVAKFTHKGHISAIRATTRAVFEEGLPAAGLRPIGPVDLIECYGADFDPQTGFGTVGLWIHVAA